MMRFEPDIMASTLRMITNCGEEAAMEARAAAEKCAKRRDPERRNTWLSIASAAEIILPQTAEAN